jgi:uncharacterized protein (DUF1800 family)
MTIEAAIAANRFGLGARAGDAPSSNPQRALIDQLQRYEPRPAALTSQPNRAALAQSYLAYKDDRRDAKQDAEQATKAAPENAIKTDDMGKKAKGPANPLRKEIRDFYTNGVEARLHVAVASKTDFAERLVHFWSNHFAVSIDKLPVVAFAADYEFTAIRPHIMGKFSDLLFAATRHPAMLVFLDQAQSIGPQSSVAQRVAARRNKELGLNENLAREILELHTLGVRTGYSQGDVTEFANALTGNTVAGLSKGPLQKLLLTKASPGESVFVEAIHEPGVRHVLGKRYAQNGAAQGDAILTDLSTHPSTAKHIATKLAQHFVSDVPPPALVARLEQGFLKSGGDLPTLYRILIEAPESWSPTQAKFKTPWEWVVSSLRALDGQELPSKNAAVLLAQLGQPVWKPGSPAGFADVAENWAGGAALMQRVEIASRLSERSAAQVDARKLAPAILFDQLSPHSAQMIARAESPAQGLALLLVAPEFLRR